LGQPGLGAPGMNMGMGMDGMMGAVGGAVVATGEEPKELSKKQKKKLTRLTVAELKQLVARPDVVEMHDANSANPRLLVYLKAYRNTVSVPKHWCQKRKYLQNKRGFEKPPFQLPQYIEDTGIGKLRFQQTSAQEQKNMKQKMREKIQPKAGKLDIDYNVLHDAFFVYQTKPKMSGHGEMYYEGKEFETKLTAKRPGEYSEELMNALGMVHGKLSPPPWLFAMQRYGPPPSYPVLKLPGVDAPLPYGARWGTRDGEWGRAPVDDNGQPLWGGDLFGYAAAAEEPAVEVDKAHWGKMEEEAEEEPEPEAKKEEEEEEEKEKEAPSKGDAVSGIESTVSTSGLATPQTIQLRKKEGTGTETPDTIRRTQIETGQAFVPLEQKDIGIDRTALFGSAHTYVIPGVAAAAAAAAPAPMVAEKKTPKRAAGQVEVALAPEELETLDAETLRRKYQQQVEAEKAAKAAMRTSVDDDDEPANKKRKTTTKEKKFKF